jgi:hypothetical protein
MRFSWIRALGEIMSSLGAPLLELSFRNEIMMRIRFLAIVPTFFFFAALGCGESSPPKREKDKSAATDREEGINKEKGGKFMRPKGAGGPVGKTN